MTRNQPDTFGTKGADMPREEVYKLAEQCKDCKLGQKPIGPRSGCDVRKKLVIDDNPVAWKHKHLFFDRYGNCKMWMPK